MAEAFSPGSVTCFFQPDGPRDGDPSERGSRGVGIKISAGAHVSVEERSDFRVRVVIDGAEADAPVTRALLNSIAPGRGFDVAVTDDVPSGQGFGMSAAGALALAVCVLGEGEEAFRAAHAAEIAGGGGLGDVALIRSPYDVSVRARPGLGDGRVVGTDIRFERLALAVLGPKVNTGRLLSIPERYDAIVAAGRSAVDEFSVSPSADALNRISAGFSGSAGLETPEVSAALEKLRACGIGCGMCMLGDSVFAEASADEVSEILGGSVEVHGCSSTSSLPRLVRRACSAGRRRRRRRGPSWRPRRSIRTRSWRSRRR